MVALDSAIIQHPRTWEASGHLAGFTDPLVQCLGKCKQRFREDHLREAPAARASCVLPGVRRRADRAARVQPHVRDHDRPGEGGGLDGLPAAGDRAGHLPRLQDRRSSTRAASRRSASRRSASRSATRSRPATSSSARSSSSRWRWSSSSRPTRPASGTSYWMQARLDWYARLGIDRERLRLRDARRRRALALLVRRPPTSSTCTRSAGRSWRASPTAATSTSPSTREFSGEKLEYFDPRDARALRPARDRARGRRRPHDARAALRRLRRGRDRRREAHRAAAAPDGGAGQGRGAAAAAQGRPPGEARARSTRSCAAT